MTSNDNDATPRESPSLHDARGHAALLLVESLIHGLCENATLSTAEAIAIADRAIDVQFDQAEAADGVAGPMWQSHAMLSMIAASLRIDGDDGSAPPRLAT